MPIFKKRPRLALEDHEALIVARSFQLPGSVSTNAQLQQLSLQMHTTNSHVPISRWAIDTTKNISASYGSFMRDEQLLFDHTTFGISALEAKSMDPQQASLLGVGYSTLHKSYGIKNTSAASKVALSRSDIGVVVGVQVSGHRGSSKPNAFSATGTSASITAGRFSYALGLIGPCYSVDTACSSALAALHICVNTVTVQRECTHGLAIGCSSLSEVLNMATSVAGMLSLRGRCHTFDERADGYCRGEGCAAFSVMSRHNAKNGPSVSILGSAVQ